jgi:hypothetical protein
MGGDRKNSRTSRCLKMRYQIILKCPSSLSTLLRPPTDPNMILKYGKTNKRPPGTDACIEIVPKLEHLEFL